MAARSVRLLMPALGRIDLARPWDDENRQQEQDHAASGKKLFA
jgi:hypothetical protein